MKRFEKRIPLVIACLAVAMTLSACRSTKSAAAVSAVPFAFGCASAPIKEMPAPVQEAVVAPPPPAPEPAMAPAPEPAPVEAPVTKHKKLRKN